MKMTPGTEKTRFVKVSELKKKKNTKICSDKTLSKLNFSKVRRPETLPLFPLENKVKETKLL